MHDVDPSVIDRDKSTYLCDNLRCVGREFLRDSNWPDIETLDGLVSQAGGLFICAATAYWFILSGGTFASDRLQDVLRRVSNASAPEQSLDALYSTVLSKVVNISYQEQEKVEFRTALYAVLKTVIVLASPVNRLLLSDLVGVGFDEVNKALLSLQSIIAIPDDVVQPVRLHHASFRDFITDPCRCRDMCFSADWKSQHKVLARRCIQLMSEHLRIDICDMRALGPKLDTVDKDVVDRRLPPSLQYTCLFWAHHVQQAEELFGDLSSILDFLFVHLLHWLEALGLLKSLSQAVDVLRSLELLTVSNLFLRVPKAMLTGF